MQQTALLVGIIASQLHVTFVTSLTCPEIGRDCHSGFCNWTSTTGNDSQLQWVFEGVKAELKTGFRRGGSRGLLVSALLDAQPGHECRLNFGYHLAPWTSGCQLSLFKKPEDPSAERELLWAAYTPTSFGFELVAKARFDCGSVPQYRLIFEGERRSGKAFACGVNSKIGVQNVTCSTSESFNATTPLPSRSYVRPTEPSSRTTRPQTQQSPRSKAQRDSTPASRTAQRASTPARRILVVGVVIAVLVVSAAVVVFSCRRHMRTFVGNKTESHRNVSNRRASVSVVAAPGESSSLRIGNACSGAAGQHLQPGYGSTDSSGRPRLPPPPPAQVTLGAGGAGSRDIPDVSGCSARPGDDNQPIRPLDSYGGIPRRGATRTKAATDDGQYARLLSHSKRNRKTPLSRETTAAVDKPPTPQEGTFHHSRNCAQPQGHTDSGNSERPLSGGITSSSTWTGTSTPCPSASSEYDVPTTTQLHHNCSSPDVKGAKKACQGAKGTGNMTSRVSQRP